MAGIIGYECDICKVQKTMLENDYKGGDPLKKQLGFTDFKISGEIRQDLCTDCTGNLQEFVARIKSSSQ
jgi:hypothetical protein